MKKKNLLFVTKAFVKVWDRGMLDQFLDFFEIVPDYDLNLKKLGQNLYGLTVDKIRWLQPVLMGLQPDFAHVHADTSNTIGTCIASFYSNAKFCHMEAGLHAFDKKAHFPEELNQTITRCIAEYHFAPIQISFDNYRKPSRKVDGVSSVINYFLSQ